MHKLKKVNNGETAAIILGGPSIVHHNWDLRQLNSKKITIFLESKALTPRLLKCGLKPDYYMMFYPEKCKGNAFHEVVLQSLLADIDLNNLVKEKFADEYNVIKDNFEMYFEPWKKKMTHKRYRYKYDVYLPGSPFELLVKLPKMNVLTFIDAFNAQLTEFNYKNTLYRFNIEGPPKKFDINDYFNPREKNDTVTLQSCGSLNSAAIALYPLLNYMGFKKIYFIGMDMSMLGSMEYAACFTFKSMRHFGIFYKKAKKVFNYSFKPRWFYLLKILLKIGFGPIPAKCFQRPISEFEDIREIFKYKEMEFINVFEPYKYAFPIKGIRNITYNEFIDEI